MLIFWLFIFAVSLAVLIKGADWLLESAEKIGLAFGLSPFVIGVVVVGIGTSLPELISSIAGVLKGVTEIVAANAIGSNIANILLIVGIAAIFGGKLAVTKNLIDLDLPLLATSTALLAGIAWDKIITRTESVFLVTAFFIYLIYSLLYKEDVKENKKLDIKN